MVGLTLYDFTYDCLRCAIKADNVKNRSIEYCGKFRSLLYIIYKLLLL